MTSTKQRIYNKLGITEDNIKKNSIFSPPQSTLHKIKPITSTDQGRVKTESTVSKKNYFSSSNILISKNNNYEACKIELLVPNSEPPKPQIQSYASKVGNSTNKSFSTAKTSTSINDHKSPNKRTTSPIKAFNKDFKRRNTDKSHLEDLHQSKKINNTELFCPVTKAHKLIESKTSSKIVKLI
jgi:hypothetical protein